MSLDEVVAATKQTTEGVKSYESVLQLGRKYDVEMPITDVVFALLHEKVGLEEAAAALMQRPPKPEC
jgi:glycerol-3-phosphate dehydrogenase (NAD(P)+)